MFNFTLSAHVCKKKNRSDLIEFATTLKGEKMW